MTDRLKQISSNEPWYKDGLRFECTGCGQCCTGAPGYIWVNYDEIKDIAQFLGLDLQTFSDRYLRKVKGRFSLREDSITYDCVFLKNNKCSIYSTRPTQCRTYPWWPTLLKSKEEWLAAAKNCEGISTCAPIVPLEKIKNQLDEQLTQKPLEVDP